MRPVAEAMPYHAWIAVDQRRSGYPCRVDPTCRFITPETLLRDTHELSAHGAVHIAVPIAHSYRSTAVRRNRHA